MNGDTWFCEWKWYVTGIVIRPPPFKARSLVRPCEHRRVEAAIRRRRRRDWRRNWRRQCRGKWLEPWSRGGHMHREEDWMPKP